MEEEVLRRESLTHDLDVVWMREIVVDGVHSRNMREHGYQFYTIKRDHWPEEVRMETDGFLDDREGFEEAFWETPYSPLSYSLGEMDEEAWLRNGDIQEMS